MFRKKQPIPDPAIIERGDKYCSLIENTLDDPGVIYDDSGTACWRFETSPKRSSHSPINLIRKPDFVLLDPDENEVLRISRYKRFPPSFHLLEKGRFVGEIRLRSLFLNRYRLEFEDGPKWTFRMPLFTTRFWGESNVNSHVWVLMGPSKTQWNILSEPGVINIPLLAGLAFIHREWWCR